MEKEAHHWFADLNRVIVLLLGKTNAVFGEAAVSASYDDKVVIRRLNFTLDKLPLFVVSGRKQFHPRGEHPHFERRLQYLVSLILQVLKRRAHENLVSSLSVIRNHMLNEQYTGYIDGSKVWAFGGSE